MGRFGRKANRAAQKRLIEEASLGLTRENKKKLKHLSVGQTLKLMREKPEKKP